MSVIDPWRIWRHLVGHPASLLVLGLICAVAGGMAGGFLAQQLAHAFPDNDWVKLLRAIIYTTFAIIGYWVFVRFVERKPFADFALPGAGREWLMGAGLGFGAMSLTIGIMALLGSYSVSGMNSWTVLVPMLAMAIASGVVEEIMLRGLIFRFLEKWLGSWIALLLSALMFGLMHLGNPDATLFAALSIALEAGVTLAAIYMVTRRLWAAIGFHAVWNFTQGGIYGADVSGFEGKGLLASKTHGAELLTGGAFGPEASLPALFICTSIGIWFLRRAYKNGQFKAMSWQRFKGIETDSA